MNYINYLGSKLEIIKRELNIYSDLIIGDEQILVQGKNPDTIFVVVKYQSVNYGINAKTQPIQLAIITEENNIERTKELFNTFTEKYNWTVLNSENEPFFVERGEVIKQQYTSPVVVSNFQEIDSGFRSIIYVNVNLSIMNNICDIENISINGIPIKPLSMTMTYSMSGNTQQFPNNYISQTVKNVSTLNFALTLPLIDYDGLEETKYFVSSEEVSLGAVEIEKDELPQYLGKLEKAMYGNTQLVVTEYDDYFKITLLSTITSGARLDLFYESLLLTRILNVSKGIQNGNDEFVFKYTINNIEFNVSTKLINCQITTAPNQIPGLNLAFME